MNLFSGFYQMVDDAVRPCYTQEFVPSRKELEDALIPVVEFLKSLPEDEMCAFVRRSFRGAGSMDALCISLFFSR